MRPHDDVSRHCTDVTTNCFPDISENVCYIYIPNNYVDIPNNYVDIPNNADIK